jgi:Mor family transcriptional regulator
MVRHNPSVISSLKADRLAGMTIPELMQKYRIPKTTIWHHISTLKLTKEAQKTISSQKGGSKKRN